MKYSIFLVILAGFCHCIGKKSAEEKSTAILIKETPYDTLKFNRRLTLDTAGCGWLWADREIIDTLTFEKVVVQSNRDTFLTYKPPRRLWTCNVPSFLMIPGDTLLVSGYVYVIYATESSGFRTWVTEIAYQEK